MIWYDMIWYDMMISPLRVIWEKSFCKGEAWQPYGQTCANCCLRILVVEREINTLSCCSVAEHLHRCWDLNRVLTTLPPPYLLPPSLPTPTFAIRCHPAIVGGRYRTSCSDKASRNGVAHFQASASSFNSLERERKAREEKRRSPQTFKQSPSLTHQLHHNFDVWFILKPTMLKMQNVFWK